MSEWPPVKPTVLNHEKDSIYLTLVDMFVEVVEPSIIQMVLQNRNWDLDAAIEDIMILCSTTSAKPLNTLSPAISENNLKVSNACHYDSVNFKANNLVKDDGSRKITSSTLLDTSNASVKGVYHENKKFSPETNQSLVNAVSDRNETSQIDLSEFTNGYNYVKAVPVPYERSVLLVRNGVRLMIILRGPPGSGKSYLAQKLLSEAGIDQQGHKKHVFSSDDFFMQNGVYVFDPNLLSQAHMFNQRNVLAAIRKHVSPIVVDNTNTQAWEMRAYADFAVSSGYDLEIVEPSSWWIFRESELSKRNVHGVPKAKIRSMIERYEKHITPKKLMQQFELQYSLNNAPPQPVINSKWKDKLRSSKSNKPKKKKPEVCPKPQGYSSTSNFKNKMPAMAFNPNGLLDNPNLQSTLKYPSLPSSSTHNFTYVSNSPVEKIYSPQNINKINVSAGFDYSKNFFSHENMRQQVDLSEQVFKSRNIPLNSVENSFQAYTPSNSNSVQNNSLHSSLKEGGCNNDSIGFESHKHFSCDKTLSKTPLMVLDHFTPLNTMDEPLPSEFGSGINIGSSKVLSPEVCMFNVAETKEDLDLSEICQSNSKVEQLGNLDEKELIAKTLMNSIIDTVVAGKGENTNSQKEPDEITCKVDTMNDLDGLWDYVLVRSNSTFIYKKLNSVPISPSTIEQNSATSKQTLDQVTNLSQKHGSYLKTALQQAEESNNRDTKSVYHKGECLVKANSDSSNEQTAFLMLGLDSALKGGKVSNLEPSENHVMTFPSESYESNGKSTIVTEPSETKKSQEHTLKKDKDVLSTIFSKKEDTNVLEYSSQMLSEEKTEAMGIIGNILNSMLPYGQSSSSLFTKDNEINSEEDNGANVLSNCSPDDWSKENIDKVIDTLETKSPKPARQTARLTVPSKVENVIFYQQNNDYSDVGTWDTVENADEHWNCRESQTSYKLPHKGPEFLPQRLRSNKKLVDSSTNTNYHDFSSVSQHSLVGAKVLIGRSREITTGCPRSTVGVSQTLLLDKSTMTLENTSESVDKFDLSQISILFPHIPESYILDMVEKCQGDIDWAVDLLLDSEHSIYHSYNESEDGKGASYCIDHEVSENNLFKVDDNFKKIHSPKLISKTPNTSNENIELKKAIESSVVLNKSHYSDQVLKVLRKKNPEYLNLIEGKHVEHDECLSDSDQLPNLSHETIPEGALETNSSDEENISSSLVERHEDDETLELVVNYDLVLQLQQKFGNSSTPKIMNMTPLVKLPVSLARQLYGYMMDSIQIEVDEQQDAIERMIAKDEEIAKMLHYQDQNLKPKLQEIMDMEVALAVHKADQEDWQDRSNNTVAAKLSKNILLETFPHIDQKMLLDMLHTHNYSLHDTVKSLKLALDVGDDTTQEIKESNSAASIDTLDQSKDGRGSFASSSEIVDPLNEAQSHRQEAATYYSMRIECLRKASDAYRSGNKPVASYYSQLAQLHKQKVEQCNSAAASCLLSTHKAGNTLDLHFLHITEAEVVLDMFLDEIINYISDRRKRAQTVFLITGRGLRSVGGVSRIKPMAIKKLLSRKVLYNEVNPGMLSALVRIDTPLSYI